MCHTRLIYLLLTLFSCSTDFILSVHTEAELLQLQRNFCSTLIIAASGSKEGKAAVANRRYALSSSAYHFQQAFQLPLWQV